MNQKFDKLAKTWALSGVQPKTLLRLGAVLGVLLAERAMAQKFTTLYSFNGGSDGAYPAAGLVLSGNTLYGTTSGGGNSSTGIVFAVNTDGTGFTNLHSFTGGSDGANPQAGLVLSGNALYGTAAVGGSGGSGAVFKLNTDGTGFSTLYSFTASDPITGTNSDGANPGAGLILSSNTLFGIAAYGGSGGNGTVFKLAIDGTGFTNLYSFTAGSAFFPYTNSDGWLPGQLVKSGTNLYGTAKFGGGSGHGTVFTISTDGSGFTTLHSFAGGDGIEPNVGLVLAGSVLYGTTAHGGSAGYGNVFKINADGTGFNTLHDFGYSDGAVPQVGLLLTGKSVYGTTVRGGIYSFPMDDGVVFTLNTDGTGFTNLYSFTPTSGSSGTGVNPDGAYPFGILILSGNTLYGTANVGGKSGFGTVFSLSLPVSQPQLTITPAAGSVILSWPSSATGFALQSATNLVSPIWTTNLPAPAVVNGQYTVTNLSFGAQQFFRLSE